MRTLIGTLLAVTFMTSSAAWANGVVHFKNEGNRAIKLYSYDWDDTARTEQYDSQKVSPGAVGSVQCRKSWWSASAPGCWVYIEDWDAFHKLFDTTRFCNTGETNPYVLTGHWDWNEVDTAGWSGLGSVKVWDPDPVPHC